ncbi:MAG: protein kinase [Caldisericia bacterium]|nr:protein kinase [Caldisericia bacterium]
MDQIQFGKYIAYEEIGRGGMSIVYKGKHPTLNKPVAIKVLSEFLSVDKGFIKRFQDEAQMLSSFRHANIVSILDYGKQGSSYFIVMDFIEGFTVKQMILETGALSLNIATNIVKNVATAVAYTHRKSIVHQDIKSSNIMVDSNGRILVTDFGLSKNISLENVEENPYEVAGTLAYSAPEQLDRKQGKVDGRTDIYSLGVVFYEMVTGKLPFADENTTVNIAYQHLNVVPESPKKIRPDLLLKSSSIIMKMLKKKQDDRYQTMDDLLKEINELEDVLQYYKPQDEEEEGSFFSFQNDDEENDDESHGYKQSDSKEEVSNYEESNAAMVFSTEKSDTIGKKQITDMKTVDSNVDSFPPVDISDPFIGREIKHRYRIQKLILRRILSRLYYGVDLVKESPVTIQLPNESRPTFKTRIDKEIQTMKKINHPGFVKFIDVIEDNGVNFVIREYVDGYTIKNLLKREKLSIKRSVMIAMDVLDALSYLHNKGIVHRDLNSDVVIVPKEGRTRISSLGFTRVEDASSVSSGEFLGVVQYTAPEQIIQSHSDVRTDIYAVGILMFEMLTGVPPFDSPLPVEVMDMHLKRVPRFPEDAQKGIPLKLQRIVLRALSKQPEQRFPTAPEMAGSLKSFLESFTGKEVKIDAITGDMNENEKQTGIEKDTENRVNVLSDTGIYRNIQTSRNTKKQQFSIKKPLSRSEKKEKDNKVNIRKIINNDLQTETKKRDIGISKENEVYEATQKKKKTEKKNQISSPKFEVKAPKNKKVVRSNGKNKSNKKKSNPLLIIALLVAAFCTIFAIYYFKKPATGVNEETHANNTNRIEWVSPNSSAETTLIPMIPLEIELKQLDYSEGNYFDLVDLPKEIEYSVSLPDSKGTFEIMMYTSNQIRSSTVAFSLICMDPEDKILSETKYVIAYNYKAIKQIVLNYSNATYSVNKHEEKTIEPNAALNDESVYIPIRFLVDSLGGKIEYDTETECITITDIDSHEYKFYLTTQQYSVDGNLEREYNPILEINDTAYLAADFLSLKMNFKITLEYNAEKQFLISLLKSKED